MSDITKLTVPELLALHARIGEELRLRGAVRSANNPTGDLAEYLFCKAFGWQQAPNSERGFDATDSQGTRYQIKARRVHSRNPSRQLSAIRDLGDDHFDILAGVLFDEAYRVTRAALVPCAVVASRARYSPHTRSHLLLLRDEVWALEGVEDVTARVQAVRL